MNKKAYVRTIEAFIAMIITFIFITFIIPQSLTDSTQKENLEIMPIAYSNPQFRLCATETDITSAEACLTTLVDDYIPSTYTYQIDIQPEGESFDTSELPEVRVFSESVFVTGNITESNPRIVRVYYWLE